MLTFCAVCDLIIGLLVRAGTMSLDANIPYARESMRFFGVEVVNDGGLGQIFRLRCGFQAL